MEYTLATMINSIELYYLKKANEDIIVVTNGNICKGKITNYDKDLDVIDFYYIDPDTNTIHEIDAWVPDVYNKDIKTVRTMHLETLIHPETKYDFLELFYLAARMGDDYSIVRGIEWFRNYMNNPNLDKFEPKNDMVFKHMKYLKPINNKTYSSVFVGEALKLSKAGIHCGKYGLMSNLHSCLYISNININLPFIPDDNEKLILYSIMQDFYAFSKYCKLNNITLSSKASSPDAKEFDKLRKEVLKNIKIFINNCLANRFNLKGLIKHEF